MYSLDLCDVYMQACKMLRLLDNAHPVGEVAKSLMFVVLVAAWLYFRIALYAVKVLKTTIFMPLEVAGWRNCDYWYFFNLLVVFVWLLQVRALLEPTLLLRVREASVPLPERQAWRYLACQNHVRRNQERPIQFRSIFLVRMDSLVQSKVESL